MKTDLQHVWRMAQTAVYKMRSLAHRCSVPGAAILVIAKGWPTLDNTGLHPNKKDLTDDLICFAIQRNGIKSQSPWRILESEEARNE